jgi:hypothetical protein
VCGLLQEALHLLGVVQHVGVEDLDRDRAIELDLLREDHRAEPARGQHALRHETPRALRG